MSRMRTGTSRAKPCNSPGEYLRSKFNKGILTHDLAGKVIKGLNHPDVKKPAKMVLKNKPFNDKRNFKTSDPRYAQYQVFLAETEIKRY